jgi:hypothetical protein
LFSAGARDEFQTKYVDQRREWLRLVVRTGEDETAVGGPAP